MNDGIKETACTRCMHREVCIYKQDFLDIYDAVFNTTVSKPCSDGKKVAMKKVTNFECLGDIIVTCRFCKPEQANIRDGIF